MKHYKPEAEHLLKKLINACNIEVENKELAVDIIADELEILICEDVDPETLGCGHDLNFD